MSKELENAVKAIRASKQGKVTEAEGWEADIENPTQKLWDEAWEIVNKEDEPVSLKEELKFEDLMFTYSNGNGTMDLEFQTEKWSYILRNVPVPNDIDEFYWDNEENVKNAIEAADESDIEVK